MRTMNNKVQMAARSQLPSADSKTHVDKKLKKSASAKGAFSSSSAQIWKSRISWRITLAVFLTILAVQAAILNFTLK